MKQTTLAKYANILAEKYPNIKKSDINKILKHGFYRMQKYLNWGLDVYFKGTDTYLYSGRPFKEDFEWTRYYINMLCRRFRIWYRTGNYTYEGYYYFALSKKEFEEYQSQQLSKGRKRKYFEFKNITLYKLFDECNLRKDYAVAIFRLPVYLEGPFIIKKDYLKTKDAELILTRQPLKMTERLLSNLEIKYK